MLHGFPIIYSTGFGRSWYSFHEVQILFKTNWCNLFHLLKQALPALVGTSSPIRWDDES